MRSFLPTYRYIERNERIKVGVRDYLGTGNIIGQDMHDFWQKKGLPFSLEKGGGGIKNILKNPNIFVTPLLDDQKCMTQGLTRGGGTDLERGYGNVRP